MIRMMLPKNLSISKRFYRIENFQKEDNINLTLHNCVPKKLFMSHIFHEEDSTWVTKANKGQNYIAYHPTSMFKISLNTEYKVFPGKDICGIELMSAGNWLVKENNGIVLLRNSSFPKKFKTFFSNIPKTSKLDLSEIDPDVVTKLFHQIRPTGYIAKTLNFKVPPILAGYLSLSDNGNLTFIPILEGFPPISIIDDDIMNVKDDDKIVFCKMVEWESGSPAKGRLLTKTPTGFNQIEFVERSLTPGYLRHNLERNLQSLLTSFQLVDKPFSKVIKGYINKEANMFKQNKAEMKNRANFLDKCVISIDPIDAKDLDDALHIEQIPDGNFQVGVHIADVSHFVKPFSPIDDEAIHRANSVYLVHKVIPMLPSILSEDLCSLNPNEDKLAFSVVFTVDSLGNVINERFCKSVINPRMRLNYDEASQMIDGDIEGLPMASHPEFGRVMESVQNLNKIALVLRENRLKNGALMLDKVELKFSLDINYSESDDKDSPFGLPSSYYAKTRSKSHFLIEEWMLLANQAAARLIYNHLKSDPNTRETIGALLRNHPPPDKKQKASLIYSSREAGIWLKHTDSCYIQKMILDLKSTDALKSLNLSYLCYFNLQLAKYFCAESYLIHQTNINDQLDTTSHLHHYGLNVPLYTHFTSPIRRYADIIVHRQIDAIIHDKANCGTDMVNRLKAAENCNAMRPISRRLQDRLTSLYLATYLCIEGWRLTKAVILKGSDTQVTILLPYQGVVLRSTLQSLVPWATNIISIRPKISEMSSIYRLEYGLDEEQYEVRNKFGFTQYLNKKNFADRKLNRSENEIEQLKKEEKYKYSKSTFRNIRIFELIDCVIYCNPETLELQIEMPFPLTDPQLLVQNQTRYL